MQTAPILETDQDFVESLYTLPCGKVNGYEPRTGMKPSETNK